MSRMHKDGFEGAKEKSPSSEVPSGAWCSVYGPEAVGFSSASHFFIPPSKTLTFYAPKNLIIQAALATEKMP